MNLTIKEIDQKIQDAIDNIQGFVTQNELIILLGGKYWKTKELLSVRLDQNPDLAKRIEEKNLFLIQNCDNATFDNLVMGKNKISRSGIVKEEFEKRKDERIICAIRAFEGGIPHKHNLHKSKNPVGYSPSIIQQRSGVNSSIEAELDKKGIEYIQNSEQADFDKLVCSRTWSHSSNAIKDAIHQRLSTIISSAIDKAKGRISGHSLCRKSGGPLPYDSKTISDLINSSRELREKIELREMENFPRKIKPTSLKTRQTVAGKTLKRN